MIRSTRLANTFPGLTNYEVPLPGTGVTAFLGVWDAEPLRWIYSLWTGTGHEDGTEVIGTGDLDFHLKDKVNLYKTDPVAVAKIAFLLETRDK